MSDMCKTAARIAIMPSFCCLSTCTKHTDIIQHMQNGHCCNSLLLSLLLHLNCTKTENNDELSHVSRCRLWHRSSVARVDAESQAGKKTKTAQHSTSESQGTQERGISTVCNRGDQQAYGIGGCIGWGNPRKSLERYQDSPAGSSQRNDWMRQVTKMDIWWDFCSNQEKKESKSQR